MRQSTDAGGTPAAWPADEPDDDDDTQAIVEEIRLRHFMRMVGAESIWDPIERDERFHLDLLNALFRFRQRELTWLRRSLDEDALPAWLIELVITNWTAPPGAYTTVPTRVGPIVDLLYDA